MRAARLSEGGGGAGTGTGIADAILFDRRLWIVRPFLACRRADIRAYLTRRGMSWLDDPSNEDVRYERVRTRKSLAQDAASPSAPDGGGTARAALSTEAAAWLDRYVTVHANVLCAVSRDALAADEVVRSYALSYLAAVFGGEPYGPGRERMRRILDFIGEGRPGRRTAGGVLFDLRRDGLYLMRESRDIQPLVLASGADGVWDGRFRIVNYRPTAVRIEAAGAGGIARSFRRGCRKVPCSAHGRCCRAWSAEMGERRICHDCALSRAFRPLFDTIRSHICGSVGGLLWPRTLYAAAALRLIDGKSV